MSPWTVAGQAPLSMEFSRQEYWSGLLFPSPGHLPDPGIELRSPALQEDSLPSEQKERKTQASGNREPNPKDTQSACRNADRVVRLSNMVALRENRVVSRSCYMEVNKRWKK